MNSHAMGSICSVMLVVVAASLFTVSVIQNAVAHGVATPPELTPEQRQRLDAASSDIFFPPEDDRLTETQILHFLRVIDKAKDIERGRLLKQLRTLRVSNRSFSPLGPGGQRVGFGSSRLSLGTGNRSSACDRVSFRLAQADAVKILDGNWAEFDWVQRNLVQIKAIDRIVGVGHDSVMEHNLVLFREHKASILAALQPC